MSRGGSSRGGRGGGSGSGSDPKNLDSTILHDLFTRPIDLDDKKGSSGVPVECLANFVPLTVSEQYGIFQYHVAFDPEIDSKRARFEIMRDPNVQQELGEHIVFDGMILYIHGREWKEEHVIEARHPVQNSPVLIRFKMSKRFGTFDPQVINLYNIIVRRMMEKIAFKQMGRNYFNPIAGSTVQDHPLEVWPGYETAIRKYEAGLMLCVENRFKVLRTDNVLKMMYEEYNRARGDRERMQNRVEEMIVGETVVTHYNSKMHKVTKIDWDRNPNSTMELRDGRVVSLIDYFKEQYNVTIESAEQPILVSEGKPYQPGEPPQVAFLVPELCYPTGLTDAMRNDQRVMRSLSNVTRLSPEQRCEATLKLLKQIACNADCQAMLQAWNISLADNLVQIPARQHPPEQLIGRNNALISTGMKAEWAAGCRNGVFRTAELVDWIIAAPAYDASLHEANRFINEISKIAGQLGAPLKYPTCVSVSDPSPNVYSQAILDKLHERGDSPLPAIIVIILHDDSKTRYDAIKKLLCTSEYKSVPSQCVLLKTLSGGKKGNEKTYGSIVLKLALQMICKMGGSLWKVNIPLKNTMIIGYDLYHDSTLRGKTIGACVATTDADFTKFYSQTRDHDNPTALGNNLSFFVKRALRQYYDINGVLPDRVFIYRDGAGDGQIPYIRSHEVELVKEAFAFVCGKVDVNHQIKLAFTIVTKKVNMRIFRRAGGMLGNPFPGTVVDDVVTRPERYDFYMVPQAVNQGTVSPVCYNIIYDDTGLRPDQHHRLAFKLCHLYYNWQGTVRVPAPCQYAHKLAFLVAQSIHQEVQDSLRDKLYFL